MSQKKVLIAGASGLVGFAALKHISQLAHWDAVGRSGRVPPGLEGAKLISVQSRGVRFLPAVGRPLRARSVPLDRRAGEALSIKTPESNRSWQRAGSDDDL